jgi:hypothetical protein
MSASSTILMEASRTSQNLAEEMIVVGIVSAQNDQRAAVSGDSETTQSMPLW